MVVCSDERLPGFHYEAKQRVSVAFICMDGEVDTGSRNGQNSKQVSIANGSIAEFDHDPKMRGQIAMERTISVEPIDYGMERFFRRWHAASFQKKVPQLSDFIRVAFRHLFELER